MKDRVSMAIDDCLREMYAKAQPAADYDEIVAKVKSGEMNASRISLITSPSHFESMRSDQPISFKYIKTSCTIVL